MSWPNSAGTPCARSSGLRTRRCEGLVLVGYSIIGAALGALSLLVFPKHFAASMPLRLATLALAPIASALAVAPAIQLLHSSAESEVIRRRFWNPEASSLHYLVVSCAGGGRPDNP